MLQYYQACPFHFANHAKWNYNYDIIDLYSITAYKI